jgi:hypothetical protein
MRLEWRPYLPLGTLVRRTVARDQGWHLDLRAPDNPAGPGLKAVLLASVDVQAKGIILLPGVLHTGPRVDHAQTMEPRGHPEALDPYSRVNALGIKRDEADGLWEHQEGIRLRLVGLRREGNAAEQPECPA